MESNTKIEETKFVSMDNGKYWVNKDYIRWIKKYSENGVPCYEVCAKPNGCGLGDTFLACSRSVGFEQLNELLKK